MNVQKKPQPYFKIESWNIIEEGFNPSKQRISESIFGLGNEYLSARGFFDEGYSGDHLQGCYFNHLYDKLHISHPQLFKGIVTEGACMINAVNWLFTRIKIDNEQLDLATSKFSGFKRQTNMKTGILTREFIWETQSGKNLKMFFERFTNMENTHIAGQKIEITPLNFSGNIEIESGLDFNALYEIASGWDQTKEGGANTAVKGKNFWNENYREIGSNQYYIQASTLKTNFPLFSSCSFIISNKHTSKNVSTEKYVGAVFSIELTENKPLVFEKVCYHNWEQNPGIESHWNKSKKQANDALTVSYASYKAEHIAKWDKIWYLLDVEIVGDEASQQGVRYSNFNVFQIYQGNDPSKNAVCKFAGEVYYGYIFWDSEIYVHRMHMFTNPDKAKNLILYRHNQLAQAMERAKEVDCEGARFPFATISGKEESGSWQHVDLEIHQDVAVAYALWHHIKVFNDKQLLYNEGIEMLIQICRFHASAGGWSPVKGDFGFYGVMGPDEFHMMVNHNCYTNYMAQKYFYYTLNTLAEMKASEPALYKAALSKTGLKDSELADWKLMADKMRILYNPETHLYEQHDGYFDLPHVDIKNLPTNQIPIYKNWAYIKIFRHNMIKQPDVLNLMYFFSESFTPEQKKANYEFYEARTIHESSLSPSLHAILAAELGKTSDALEFIRYASRLDLDNYNHNTEQGIHSTAGAGVWSSVVFGFGGMRTDGDVLSFRPVFPKEWESLKFRVAYKDSVICVKISTKGSEFVVEYGGDVQVKINDKLTILGKQPIQFALA